MHVFADHQELSLGMNLENKWPADVNKWNIDIHECEIMQINAKNKCCWCCAVAEVDNKKVQKEYIGGSLAK